MSLRSPGARRGRGTRTGPRTGSAAERQDAADEALIRAVYSEHGGALLAFTTRLLGDRAAAEDVVQEVLVRAWQHADVLTNGKGSVRSWLFTVARNLATDRVRARRARPAEVAEDAAPPPPVGDHADRVVDSLTVLPALERLSADHREVLQQVYFQGRSLPEAAAVLGVPPGTVKSRSYYALRALRTALVGRDPVDGAVTP
ncbi:MAG: polymerase [Pseudonocardia sp.]|jgi:RNA polymerase sigma-70 factor (ECF subfamily)|uniref:sigma-70 family RNA polymerase sigma factor n=1 Tax=Pseudonocardia sp. TaxID=60912 RepID=UPI0026354479|nr:sigma-70 family RNA polymerase sigma factor [Pseudonocardia sp.]MCU1629439.1 polymerase [Pseudonocardia sp.]